MVSSIGETHENNRMEESAMTPASGYHKRLQQTKQERAQHATQRRRQQARDHLQRAQARAQLHLQALEQACVPCLLSCLGVNVPRPGVRGAEGPGKRQGVTVRWGLKAAWNAGAGRGTRTGYEVWYRRGERARDRKALPPHVDCA